MYPSMPHPGPQLRVQGKVTREESRSAVGVQVDGSVCVFNIGRLQVRLGLGLCLGSMCRVV